MHLFNANTTCQPLCDRNHESSSGDRRNKDFVPCVCTGVDQLYVHVKLREWDRSLRFAVRVHRSSAGTTFGTQNLVFRI